MQQIQTAYGNTQILAGPVGPFSFTGAPQSAEVLSGAGVPTADPGVSNAIYTDTNTQIQYSWWGGAWH